MKLLICLCTITIISALRPPVFRRDTRPRNVAPHLTRRNGELPIYMHGVKRNIVPLYLHRNQKFLNPVPRKIPHLKQTALPSTDQTTYRGNVQINANNDWIPISPTVQANKNNYPIQSQKTTAIRQVVRVPLRLPARAVLPHNSAAQNPQPKINQQSFIAQQLPQTVQNPNLQAFLQPEINQQLLIQQLQPQTANSFDINPFSQPKLKHASLNPQQLPQTSVVSNQFSAPHNQIVPESAINSKLIFNPFQSNVQQINTNEFFISPNAPTQNTLSPIFSSRVVSGSPDTTRNKFLENFNIEQFLEQQKTFKPTPTPSVPDSLKNNPFINYFNNFKTAQNGYNPENHKTNYAPLSNNYRDDRTHEPSVGIETANNNEEPEVKRGENERAPKISQDTAFDVPTKPIYPGEGQWAKPGRKHTPYVKTQQYDTINESTEKPDGYETFLEGEKLFNIKQGKFQNQLNDLPVKENLGQFLSNPTQSNVNNHQEQNDESESEEEEFVPSKLYAQVRHSENEEHLPAEEADDDRLKELVRDSKIQTVYTEEGYEDIGYDHAGHEKLAENDEGFEETDRELRKSEEKKRPKMKEIKESTGYTKGDELMTDEEIEADKAALIGIVTDSDSGESQYVEFPGTNVVDSPERKNKKKKKNSGLEKKTHSKKDFISTKEIKTMTTKDNDDGNTEMEITGEVKVVMQPNNSSQSHEFTRKLPTIHKLMKAEVADDEEIALVEEMQANINKNSDNSTAIYIEEIISENATESVILTTTLPPEIDSVEIPVTTLPTTALPKTTETLPDNLEELPQIDEAFSKINRRKRFTNDFPEINVETDFISTIKHNLGTNEPDLTLAKYPYYRDFRKFGLHENSPLRYAEDMRNIPKKEEGNMAFYEQAESRISCPEIVSKVEPIPERVVNAEEEATEDEEDVEEDDNDAVHDEEAEGQESQNQEVHEQPQAPRLSGLGDKIDCLKVMYFGENPLDSPFFKEETVGAVKPIFDFKSKSFYNEKKKKKLDVKVDQKLDETVIIPKVSPIVIDNGNIGQVLPTIKEPVKVDKNETEPITTFRPDVIDNGDTGKIQLEKINSTISSKVSTDTNPTEANLMTTPSYKINLKPKNIYDQIHLLNYLPEGNNSTLDILKMNTDNSDIPKAEKFTGSSLLDSIRVPRKLVDSSTNGSLDAESLIMNRRRRIRLRPKHPAYEIFDITKYMPTTPYPVLGHFLTTTTTASPKSKLKSEVFYKNNIKPNEQMNVFTDILNNIKTFSADNIESSSMKDKSILNDNRVSEAELNLIPPKTTFTNAPKQLPKLPYGHDSYLQAYKNMEVDSDFYSSITTSPKPVKVSQAMNTYDITESTILPAYPAKLANPVSKKHFMVFLPPTVKPVSLEISSTPKPQQFVTTPIKNLTTTFVKGLFPPRQQNFIHSFKRDNKIFESNQERDPADTIVNKFLFMGMKPPPMQKVYVYSDFLNKHPQRKRKYSKRRSKRSTSRISYAPVSRRRGSEPVTEKQITTTESEDDYVPHRSKNYYYDEKLGKIVYLNQNNKKEEEEEELEEPVEIVFEEVKEERKRTKSTTPKQNPIFATATPPPEGQSYLDFVKILKSHSNYRDIPDPVSTEASQQVTTTLKPVSTTPPEFLNILAKVRSDNNYKIIEDPDEKKSKRKTTTTPATEEVQEVEEDEEDAETYQNTNVKNSGGGDVLGNDFKIFDITEYIPKLKNYLPQTAVDTSKYKTIQRVNHRTTPSEDEEVTMATEASTRHQEINRRPHRTEEPENDELKIVIEDSVNKDTNIVPTSTVAVASSTVATGVNSRRAQIIRTRGRRPSRPSVTTPAVTSTTEPIPRSTRRRVTRLHARTTTEKYLNEHESGAAKVLRRRSNLPKNEQANSDVKGIIKESETTLTSRSPKKIDSANNAYQLIGAGEGEDIKDVGVFKKYDPNIKHGGNYRRIFSDEEIASFKQDILRDSEINQSAKPEKIQASKDVNIFQKYEPNQRTGGNYRKESEAEVASNQGETPNDNRPSTSGPKNDVEIVAEYDKSQKHGGNYKDEDEQNNANTENENVEQVAQPSDEEVVNHEVAGEVPQDSNLSKREESAPLKLSLLGDYYVEQPKPPIDQNMKRRRRRKRKRLNGKAPKKTYRNPNRQVTRLTDVVPKPETFFTDPNLPLAVNMLVDSSRTEDIEITSRENSEEIVTTTETNFEIRAIRKDNVKPDSVINSSSKYETNVRSIPAPPSSKPLFIENNSEIFRDVTDRVVNFPLKVEASTKKPVFIKDPSKRLYFYAPL